MESFTNDEIIEGIRSQNRDVLRYVYTTYFPDVRKMVVKFGGSVDDAKDLFQESVILIYRKLKQDNIILNRGFHQYILGVCRNVFIEQKSKNDLAREKLNQLDEFNLVDEPEASVIRRNYEYRLYQYHFANLGRICQEILTMILQKIPVKTIAEKLKTTEGYIHSRKYKCKEQLIHNIKSDPKFGKEDEE